MSHPTSSVQQRTLPNNNNPGLPQPSHSLITNPIFLITVSVASGLIIFLLIVYCIRRFRSNQPRNLFQSNNFNASAAAQPSYNSLTNNKLWFGANPTELNFSENHTELSLHSPQSSNASWDKHATLITIANYCRSSKFDRKLIRLLPDIGHRTAKFYALLNDSQYFAGETNSEDTFPDNKTILTIINTDSSELFDYSSTKLYNRISKLLRNVNPLEVNHPNIARISSVDINNESNYLLVGYYSSQGSLRDLIHSTTENKKFSPYENKYLQLNKQSNQMQPKIGQKLKLPTIISYSYQILQGLKFLDYQCIPYFFLHSGNILITQNNTVKLADYGNFLFGFKNRQHKKLKKIATIDPMLLAFAIILYEMATGRDPEVNKSNNNNYSEKSESTPTSPTSPSFSIDLNVPGREFNDLNDLINTICNAKHPITSWDELLSHKLYKNIGKLLPLEAIQQYQEFYNRPVTTEAKVLKKVVKPALAYYTETVYNYHPLNIAGNIPKKIKNLAKQQKSQANKEAVTIHIAGGEGDLSDTESTLSSRSSASTNSSTNLTQQPQESREERERRELRQQKQALKQSSNLSTSTPASAASSGSMLTKLAAGSGKMGFF
jgi:hypothetical protein